MTPDEAVEKQLKNILTAKWMCGENLPTPRSVDRGAFCEANFLRYVIEIFSFGFFYSLNEKLRGEPLLVCPAGAQCQAWQVQLLIESLGPVV